MFSSEFCIIYHNTSFKEPVERLLLHKHSFCFQPYHSLSLFQKRCHTCFLAEYFFRLNLQAGNKSQLNISNSFKLAFSLFSTQSSIWDEAFLMKVVNSLKPLSIFAKKDPLQMFDQLLSFLNTSRRHLEILLARTV